MSVEIPNHAEVKESTLDAAALLLSVLRNDIEGVNIIFDAADQRLLLSGMIAIAHTTAVQAFGDNAATFIQEYMMFLNTLSETDWQHIAEGTVVIGVNE